MYKNIKLFAMPNSQKLGKKIAEQLKIEISLIKKTQFVDGEILIQSKDTVRNKIVFIVASNCKPVNDNIMELLIFIDSLKRASAKKIVLINTYYGYSRQDRKVKGRQPITAKLFADMLQVAGINKLISVDLHNPSIQGFFNVPVDDLKGQYALASEITKIGKYSVVSPDHGGATRARSFAELISNSIKIAIVDKRRTGPNESKITGILGNVKDKNCVIIDDIIDTGYTIINAAQELKKQGAKNIMVLATHGLFSKGFEHFEKSEYIDRVMVTDSIELVHNNRNFKKLHIVSLAKLLSLSINALVNGKSLFSIYQQMEKELNIKKD